MKRYFLTGTDTDAGKTLISAALLQRAVLDGHTSFGLKPIASGSDVTEVGLRNRDALLHQKYSSGNLGYEVHNPITLKPAIAPHIAAQEAGLSLTCSSLIESCENGLIQTADYQLIEGAGGWLVPLNDKETLADFTATLDLPVILVIGLKQDFPRRKRMLTKVRRQFFDDVFGPFIEGDKVLQFFTERRFHEFSVDCLLDIFKL